MLVGYFNTDLDAPEGQDWDEGIAAAMEEELLEDISAHFLPQHKLWLKDDHTWAMHWGSREVCSQTEHILSTDSCLFQNVAIRDASHNTDHYLVL